MALILAVNNWRIFADVDLRQWFEDFKQFIYDFTDPAHAWRWGLSVFLGGFIGYKVANLFGDWKKYAFGVPAGLGGFGLVWIIFNAVQEEPGEPGFTQDITWDNVEALFTANTSWLIRLLGILALLAMAWLIAKDKHSRGIKLSSIPFGVGALVILSWLNNLFLDHNWFMT